MKKNPNKFLSLKYYIRIFNNLIIQIIFNNLKFLFILWFSNFFLLFTKNPFSPTMARILNLGICQGPERFRLLHGILAIPSSALFWIEISDILRICWIRFSGLRSCSSKCSNYHWITLAFISYAPTFFSWYFNSSFWLLVFLLSITFMLLYN